MKFHFLSFSLSLSLSLSLITLLVDLSFSSRPRLLQTLRGHIPVPFLLSLQGDFAFNLQEYLILSLSPGVTLMAEVTYDYFLKSRPTWPGEGRY